MSSDKYLKQIQKAAGAAPPVPDASQVFQTTPPPIPRKGIQSGQFTEIGLVLNREINQAEWLSLREAIQNIKRAYQWIIGDWMVYGLDHGWMQSYEDMAKLTGLKEKTVKEYTSICRNIPASIRMDKLSFGHFQLIAPLSDEDKPKWIQLAVDKNMSVRDLYNAIHRRSDPPPPLDKEDRRLLKEVTRHLRNNTLEEISGDDAVMLPKVFERILRLVKASRK